MAQGGFKTKPSSTKKSKPAYKKQKQKQLSKGRKAFSAKGKKKIQSRPEVQTTKAINAKNEITVAARVVGSGNTFALKDIEKMGKKEVGKQRQELSKKGKGAKMSERLREQLNKLK